MNADRWTKFSYAILVAFSLFAVLIPAWILIVNSFKTRKDAAQVSLGLPDTWNALENYRTAFVDGHVLQGFLNTLIVVVPAIAITLVVGSMAAWMFARHAARTVRWLYYLAITPIIVPAALLPTIFVLRALGVQNTQFGLIVFYAAIFLGFTIFLMTGFMKTIPRELEEAARVDGAGPWRIFFRIVMPLSAPGLVALTLILVIVLWNDFFWPVFLLGSQSQQTLTVGLYYFISGQAFEIRWELVFAHVVLISAPLIIVFVVAQRRLVEGITSGAVK